MLFLFPDRVRVELRCRDSLGDMFIEDDRDIGFGDFRVPGVVGIDDHGRALFAGAQASGAAHEDLAGLDARVPPLHRAPTR